MSEWKENIDLRQSFLSFLNCNDENDITTTASKMSTNGMTSLWSLASLDDSNSTFYVPNLLPAVSPKRPRAKTPQKTPNKSSNKAVKLQNERNEEAIGISKEILSQNDEAKDETSKTPSKDCVINQSKDDCQTSLQTSNMEIEEEGSNNDEATRARKTSCEEDNDVLPSSGFCVPINSISQDDKVIRTNTVRKLSFYYYFHSSPFVWLSVSFLVIPYFVHR